MNLGFTIGGYALAAIFFGLWLHTRDKVVEERESCNTEKVMAIAEAEKVARITTTNAFQRQLDQLDNLAKTAERARQIAEKARIEAESRPERVRTVIRNAANEDQCLDIPVHPNVLQCLRNDKDCGEASTG